MSLRQLYEQREITEVRWIKGDNNPADFMIKAKASTALKTLIDTNKVNLTASKWVKCDTEDEEGRNRGTKAL